MKSTIKFLVLFFGLQLASVTHAEAFRDCPDCPEMVAVPAGSFDMGVNGVSANEKPLHKVTFAQPFAMGVAEVTQAQWTAVMGSNPSFFAACGDTCPVEMVNWDEAQDFVKKLSAKTGKQYRLPSEAEWEYACLAGGTQNFCGGDSMDAVGWHSGNKNNATHPVGGKQANAFGIFDMSGNVSEWVEDSYHENYVGAPTDGSAWQGDGKQRVMRGGPWNYPPQLTRAAIRFADKPANHFNFNGFRVARVMP